ncbi:MAG: tetratricopeptide repeat protein [Gemmatimonadales bacterium]|nr:MAG: tetratricopeptide repeat protein [Gemmatimonadales bacterium]
MSEKGPDLFDRLEMFWGELVRRRVVHVAGVYAIVSWIAVYMVATTYEKLFLPDAVFLTLVALTFLGFPVVLVLAWYFRLGRGGVRFRRAGAVDDGAYGDRRASGNAAGAGLLVFGLLLATGSFLAVADRLIPEERAAVTLEEGSVAVLPFANLSGEEANRYFSDGMTEEVIARLARISDLKVISRTSAMRYRNTNLGPGEIGRELGVASILEGSVQRDGERLRISARLVDTRSTQTLWAESYDRGMEDIFAIQTALADRIATSLGLALAGIEPATAVEPDLPTGDLVAYDLYLRGRFFWNQRSPEALVRSIELFEEAITRDPDFHMAYAGLADSWVVMPYHTGGAARESLDRALEAAERALVLRPELGEAHAARAFALTGQWQWEASEEEFRRALELSPGYATGHEWHAVLLMARGRTEEALEAIRGAFALDPLSRVISYVYGLVLLISGEPEEALFHFDRALELDPTFPLAHLHRSWVLEELGRDEEMVEALERWNALFSEPPFAPGILRQAYLGGGTDETFEFLAGLPPGIPVSALDRARWSLRLGRTDEALTWLERGIEERDVWFVIVNVSPANDPLRGEQRFTDLLSAMNLEGRR